MKRGLAKWRIIVLVVTLIATILKSMPMVTTTVPLAVIAGTVGMTTKKNKLKNFLLNAQN
jgi:hypothetical protein